MNTIECDIVFSLNGVPVPTTAFYDPAHPFEVKFTFFTEDVATWVFARDLIIEGQFAMVGQGDIKVAVIDDRMHFLLSSPSGEAEISCPLSEISLFIQAMVIAVPVGQEQFEVDDDEIMGLMS